MVLEMQQAQANDVMTYDDSKPAVNSVEFGPGNRTVTVRTGVKDAKFEQALKDYNADRTSPVRGWIVHVSTQDNEYLFEIMRKYYGNRIDYFQDGETNEHVYIFNGCSGGVMEVEYKLNHTYPAGDNTNIVITEAPGQIVYGRYKPRASVALKEQIGQLNSYYSVIRTGGSGVAEYMSSKVNNVDTLYPSPITYRTDQPSPFLESMPNLAYAPTDLFDSRIYGTTYSVYVPVAGKTESIDLFVGHWKTN